MLIATTNAVSAGDIVFLASGAGAAGLYLTVLWASLVLFVGRGSAAAISAVAMIAGMMIRLGLLAGLAFIGVQAAPGLRELAFAIGGFLLVRLIVLKSIRLPETIPSDKWQGRA